MPIKTSPPAVQIIAVDEGDDATSSSLSFTLDASGTLNATSYAWTCTAVPGAGDPAFPTGTTTGAQTIATPSAVSTNVTVTGPGRYVFTVTPDGDASKAQTVSVLVSRPLPVLQAATPTRVDGEAYDDAAGASTITLSETAGADSPTYSTAGEVASTGSAMSITDSTSTTPSWTNPGGATTGETVTLQHVVTDAYGRTDSITYSERIAGSGGGGGGGFTWSVEEEIDLTDGDVTSGSKAGTGAFTILESDGVTTRIAGEAITTGTASGDVTWDNTGVEVDITSGTSAFYAVFALPVSSLADEEMPFHLDFVIDSLTIPVGGIALIWMGPSGSGPASGNASVGVEIFNNAGTYQLRTRRTSSGATFGYTKNLGGAPSGFAARIESRGGRAVFAFSDDTATNYLADNVSGATAGIEGGDAHGEPGGIASATLWAGAAYIGIGGTNGVTVRCEKWRTRELS